MLLVAGPPYLLLPPSSTRDSTAHSRPDREDMPPQRQASTPAVYSARFFQSRPQGCQPHSYAAPTKSPVNAPADSTAVDADGSIPTEMEIMLTELRGAYGLRPRSSPATTAPTPTFTSVFATTPSEVLSAMNHVAPQVFGEMPGIAPSYYSGNHNQIQSSLVSNLSEQNLDGLPYHYSFDNLNSRSVFLADGTGHRYYVLPEEYPLEQAPQPMSLSAMKHVGVKPQPSLAAQATGLAPVLSSKVDITADSESLLIPNLQLPKNVQDAPHVFKETPVYDIYEEEYTACLNIMSDVRDFTLELHQQDDERACNCSVLKASDSSQENHGIQFLWDPGTPPADYHLDRAVPEPIIPVYDDKTDGCSTKSVPMFSGAPKQLTYEEEQHENMQAPKCFCKPIFSPERPTIGTAGVFSLTNEQKLENELCGEHVKPQRVNNQQWHMQMTEARRKEWDPGIEFLLHELLGLSKGTGYALRHLQAVKFGTHNSTYFTDLAAMMCCLFANFIQQRTNIAVLLQFCQYKLLSSVVCIWDPGIALSLYRYSWLESDKAGHKTVKALVWLPSPFFDDLQYHLPMSNTASIWDPGILNEMDNMLCKTAVPHLAHSDQTTFKLLSFLGQPADLKQFLALWLLLQSPSGNNTSTAFPQAYVKIKEMDIIFITFLPP